ncbi:MAG TPA: HNH endonuclease, partial [Acidimicrobiia bacterium]
RQLNGYTISHKNNGDTRTHDQLRADILMDLLECAHGTQIRGKGSVDVRVDLTTLAGLDDKAAEIPGFGPIIADIARQVAEQQTKDPWTFTVTDDNGNIIATGNTRRRPTTGHTRHLAAIWPRCVFPGCRMPAADCDIDHNQPRVEGGPTTIENTTPKCRHDHRLRHQGGWDYQFLEGQHQWTSPLGHTYITERPPP